MRLFGYYAFHSFINQIRKLLKTWVLIFILCCGLVGGLIGYGAAMLTDYAEEQSAEEQTEEDETVQEAEPAQTGEETAEAGPDWELPITGMDIFELAAGAVILGMFLFSAYMADQNGSKIFLPADVTLLFSSPMKPQAVLMFRLCTQMGMLLFFTVYMFIEIPSLVLSLGLTVGAAAAIIIAWGFLMIFGRLIQLSLYIVGSVSGRARALIRPVIWGILGVTAVSFLAWTRISGAGIPEAAAGFFNARITRWIPFWGWLKGFCMYAIEGNLGMAVVMAVLLVGSSALLIWLIWQIKADFYEDAMAKSEETARIQREMQERGTLTFRGARKKDRSETLIRDGMEHGFGANVFFFRILYNRFRFSRFHFLTKTLIFYLAVGAGAAWFLRMLAGSGGLELFTVTALILGALVFFRSLGNPLDEDVRMAYFQMIPEPSTAKLFWSLAGGSVNTALDLLPGLIAAGLLLQAHPMAVLGWLLLLITVDLYSTTVATFIDISVPIHAGATVKQLVQVMFVYFGLLPAAVIVAVGYFTDRMFVCLVLAALVHLVIGLIFLVLGANAMEPASHVAHPAKLLTGEEKAAAKGDFSWCLLCTFMILAVGSVLQILVLRFIGDRFPQLLETEWGIWVFGFMPLHLIAFPIGLLLMRKVPERSLPGGGMELKEVILSLPCTLFLMYGGNIIGTYLDLAVRRLFGMTGGPVNVVAGFAMQESLFWKILVMVILAPVLEELVFRKALISRLHIYGQRTAVILSAAAFGLFHANVPQTLYAGLMGLLLGYVYVRTGKLRYTIGLHVIVNFLGTIAAPMLLERVDLDAVTSLDPSSVPDLSYLAEIGLLPFLIYILFILLMAAAGLVLLVLYWKRIDFDPESMELTGKDAFRAACLNPGMLLFLAGTIGMMIINYTGIPF